MLTIEIEHIDVDAIEAAAKLAGVDVEPTPSTIRVGGGDGGGGVLQPLQAGVDVQPTPSTISVDAREGPVLSIGVGRYQGWEGIKVLCPFIVSLSCPLPSVLHGCS